MITRINLYLKKLKLKEILIKLKTVTKLDKFEETKINEKLIIVDIKRLILGLILLRINY